MNYVTKAGNLAKALENAKLKQRLELLRKLKKPGAFLELFAGKGFLSQIYADYASQLFLVDENMHYLQQAEKRVQGRVSYRLFCKNNLDFIREDLPSINDLCFVDFDAFGSPAKQIQSFFRTFVIKKPLLVAVTDGLGLRWGWVCTNYRSFENYSREYFVELPKQQVRRAVHVPRDFVKFFEDLLMMQIAKKYNYRLKKVNESVRRRGFPVYLGYMLEPRKETPVA